jgi:hypothetical protein
MEVKRTGLLVTLKNIEPDEQERLSARVHQFINMESSDVYVNVWDMGRQGFTFDIYCESDVIVKRLEEWLNECGYALRLTPKKVQVG